MQKINIGMIGGGYIARVIQEHLTSNWTDRIEQVFVCDTNEEKIRSLFEGSDIVSIENSIEETVEKSDLIIECANADVVRKVLFSALDNEKDLLLLSVDGLIDCEDLIAEFRKKELRLILPSGAVAGIDAVKAARIAGIEEIKITTRKAPDALKDASYLDKNNIDIHTIKSEQIIFEGTVSEGIKAFPGNINESVMLSIAGVGPQRTKIRMIVSPELRTSVQEIFIKSRAGEVMTETKNAPCPKDPRSPYLSPLSAIAAIEGYLFPLRLRS